MFNVINNLRDNILESFQDIDYDGYLHNRIDKSKLDKAFSLVRSFVAESLSLSELEDEASRYTSILERYYNEYKLFSDNKLQEGFYNPFDEDDYVTTSSNKSQKQYIEETPEIKVSKVKLWNSNVTDKIYFDKGKMRAGKFYGKGDTIEVCPVRLIHDDDLYSRNVRDMAFVIDSEKHIYAIPFGYASYYRNSKDVPIEANADYELIPSENPTIRIFATSNIRKNNEIVLFATDDDFENEIRPGQFNYEPHKAEPYLSIKNFKII